jgi:hypothetical protein
MPDKTLQEEKRKRKERPTPTTINKKHKTNTCLTKRVRIVI